jgi:hypothetical protein
MNVGDSGNASSYKGMEVKIHALWIPVGSVTSFKLW